MNAHTTPTRESTAAYIKRLCAEQEAQRRIDKPELAAVLDRIHAAQASTKAPGFWGRACVARCFGEDLRAVKVLDPDTDTMGFVLFPMTAGRAVL